MYAREIGGETLAFGVSGKLLMNVLVMYDQQTDSLWSQFTGDAVAGPKKGTRLEFIPAQMIAWWAWLELHPDTLALDKGGFSGFDPYIDYYNRDSAGVLGEAVQDDRLQPKELVLGLEVKGLPRAYSIQQLGQTPVINDIVNELPLVVVFDGASVGSAVYQRQVNGQELTFSLLEQEGEGPPQMRDEATGTTWSVLTGVGLEGPLAGTTLQRMPSNYVFWFAWTDFHPDTELYGE